jgi:hypothetical protein
VAGGNGFYQSGGLASDFDLRPGHNRAGRVAQHSSDTARGNWACGIRALLDNNRMRRSAGAGREQQRQQQPGFHNDSFAGRKIFLRIGAASGAISFQPNRIISEMAAARRIIIPTV